ncbi:hypothetical protein KR100_01580 [Synechococcus sp. KORDI-100]|nr:hypothetical protein KR100_01580 [Synechococcus sp. KORDI-100]
MDHNFQLVSMQWRVLTQAFVMSSFRPAIHLLQRPLTMVLL